jgi:hypothetical protein
MTEGPRNLQATDQKVWGSNPYGRSASELLSAQDLLIMKSQGKVTLVKILRVLLISILVVNFSNLINHAHAFKVQSKCITLNVVSAYPFPRPIETIDGRYTIFYENICAAEIPSVEIALVEKDGYDYRVLSGGGRIGKVTIAQKGSVELTLSHSTFSQTQSMIYLYVKENYPLESRSQIAMTNVNFSSVAITPKPQNSPTPVPTPTPSKSSQTTLAPSTDSSERDFATFGGLRASWPKRLYMPQTPGESLDLNLRNMVVEVENTNSSGFFWDITVGMELASGTLPATGSAVIPTLAYVGALNSGTKGIVNLPLSYLYFLGLKGPIEAYIWICASEKRLASMDTCVSGSLMLEHVRSNLTSNSSKSAAADAATKAAADKAAADAATKAAADKAAADAATKAAADKAAADLKAKQEAEAKAKQDASKKKTTITCVKGKKSQKVTGINPKCPKGFKLI